MSRYTIDCRRVRWFADFVEAANVGLIRLAGAEWNGNLDAFNDYLTWPAEDSYELELLGSADCIEGLGHQAMAQWIRQAMRTCHPDNVPHFATRLKDAEAERGPTLFETLREIIESNEHVRLLLS